MWRELYGLMGFIFIFIFKLKLKVIQFIYSIIYSILFIQLFFYSVRSLIYSENGQNELRFLSTQINNLIIFQFTRGGYDSHCTDGGEAVLGTS